MMCIGAHLIRPCNDTNTVDIVGINMEIWVDQPKFHGAIWQGYGGHVPPPPPIGVQGQSPGRGLKGGLGGGNPPSPPLPSPPAERI